MPKCPKCGATVGEEKAFCQNCGSPMMQSPAQDQSTSWQMGATIVAPPPRHRDAKLSKPGTEPARPTGGTSTTAPATTPTRASTPTPTPPPTTTSSVSSRMAIFLGLSIAVIVLLLLVILALLFLYR